MRDLTFEAVHIQSLASLAHRTHLQLNPLLFKYFPGIALKYSSGKVQVDFLGTKTSSPVV